MVERQILTREVLDVPVMREVSSYSVHVPSPCITLNSTGASPVVKVG